MSVLVTLGGYTPPARSAPDNTLWEQARIEEKASGAADSTATVVEEAFTLDPAVTDPASPPTYTFSTENATIGVGGLYRVVWIDEADFEQPTPWVQYLPYRPTLAEVAALERTRLKAHGQQLDTFTDATRPTADQAAEAISIAVGHVHAHLGDTLPEGLWPAARHLVALYAAMLIEASYFPEQSRDEDTIYARYREMFNDGLTALIDALRDTGTGRHGGFASLTLVSPYSGDEDPVPAVSSTEDLSL